MSNKNREYSDLWWWLMVVITGNTVIYAGSLIRWLLVANSWSTYGRNSRQHWFMLGDDPLKNDQQTIDSWFYLWGANPEFSEWIRPFLTMMNQGHHGNSSSIQPWLFQCMVDNLWKTAACIEHSCVGSIAMIISLRAWNLGHKDSPKEPMASNWRSPPNSTIPLFTS